MKSIFRPLLAVIALIAATFTAKAQDAPTTIYGHEYRESGNTVVTVMKSDNLKVTTAVLTSHKKPVTFRTKEWTDPAVTSPSEEVVLVFKSKRVDFTGPVTLTLYNGKSVVGTYRLDTHSVYGQDFLDFYTEVGQ